MLVDAVALMGRTVKAAAERTADCGGFGCAKLVVFCNAVEDNPFMAGAFHGVGEPERVINVGVSGPGVVRAALAKLGPDHDLTEVADLIKKTAFKITRMGQLVGHEASTRLGIPFGIVDLSLAPTPAVGDSVAHILEEMGLETCGCHGTTAAPVRTADIPHYKRKENSEDYLLLYRSICMSVPRSSFLSPNLFFASIIQHNSIYMHVFFIDFFQSDFYNKLVKILSLYGK